MISSNGSDTTLRVRSCVERGQAVIEWVLLLGVIIVPMIAMIFFVMNQLEGFYAQVSWIIALPFP